MGYDRWLTEMDAWINGKPNLEPGVSYSKMGIINVVKQVRNQSFKIHYIDLDKYPGIDYKIFIDTLKEKIFASKLNSFIFIGEYDEDEYKHEYTALKEDADDFIRMSFQIFTHKKVMSENRPFRVCLHLERVPYDYCRGFFARKPQLLRTALENSTMQKLPMIWKKYQVQLKRNTIRRENKSSGRVVEEHKSSLASACCMRCSLPLVYY
jgi:hypothetical protein